MRYRQLERVYYFIQNFEGCAECKIDSLTHMHLEQCSEICPNFVNVIPTHCMTEGLYLGVR